MGDYYPQMDELFWRNISSAQSSKLKAQGDPQITPIFTDYIRSFN
jgi:hypothetical protein